MLYVVLLFHGMANKAMLQPCIPCQSIGNSGVTSMNFRDRFTHGTGERIGRFNQGIPPEDWLIECDHMTATTTDIYYEGLQHHTELSLIGNTYIWVKIRFDLWSLKTYTIYTPVIVLGHWTHDQVLAKIWLWMSTLLDSTRDSTNREFK